jgi:hypothetical protein
LRPLAGFPIHIFELDIVTNLKGSSGNSLFLLGMKEQPTWQFTKSYKYDSWTFTPGLRHDLFRVVDFFKSYRPGRVPGAAPWVAPNTISPMDVRPGVAIAICIEGGIFGDDLKNNSEIQVELPGTGREEAILIDPTEPVIFCAHSKPSGSGLMVSRINIAKPNEKLTIELPGSITHIVTDPRPVTGPNLEYNRARAISLRATSDALFVSHARKIYVLDKTRLTERQNILFNLPVRLIHARRVKLPGENHEKYGAPQECYLIWAIGSRYVGDGQIVRAEDYTKAYETELYRIALLP